MTNKQAVGRPSKVNYTVMKKLEDALSHGATIAEATSHAGISRDTYYRHFRDEIVFAEKMKKARTNLLYLSTLKVSLHYDI